MTAPLVGLVGKARSGKDTFASGLALQGFHRVAFADPLRRALEELDPLVSTSAPGWPPVTRLSTLLAGGGVQGGYEAVKATPYAAEVRRLLQRYGQSIRRVDPEFWLRAGLGNAREHRSFGRAVVITDVRYANEADAIRADGGVLVRVIRPGLVSSDTHASEVELDAYVTDAVVHNTGSAAELVERGRTFQW
jgi:hypothetical protein